MPGTLPECRVRVVVVQTKRAASSFADRRPCFIVLLHASVLCTGPAANDTSNGHYLYYYRSGLDPQNPAGDLANRIAWAAKEYAAPAGQPLFLLVFGGLGLYGGHDDFFLFVQRVMDNLRAHDAAGDVFEVVGAQELARLARHVGASRPEGSK